MVPPLKPSVPWDVDVSQGPGAPLLPPGRYWFAMTQRHQQTGWGAPSQVARDIPYNPYSDPHAMAARVQPDPVTFVGLPPENYKESFLSDVIEINTRVPWNVARVHVGRDTQPRPDYWMATPSAQHGQPFPIAPQIYHAFYVSSNNGLTWKLYATHKASLAGPYTLVTPMRFNRHVLNQVMGHFPDDVRLRASKVYP